MPMPLVVASEQIMDYVVSALPDDVPCAVAAPGSRGLPALAARSSLVVLLVKHDGTQGDHEEIMTCLLTLKAAVRTERCLRALYATGAGAKALHAASELIVPLPADLEELSAQLAQDLAPANPSLRRAVKDLEQQLVLARRQLSALRQSAEKQAG